MFCFRILKSTQVPQSFLFASALFRFTRFASSTPLLTLSLFLFTCFALFVALSFLSAYTDNGNGSGRSSHSPYSFCVSVSAIALCAHIRFEPKNPQTHNNKRTLWTIFLLFRFAFLHFTQCFPLLLLRFGFCFRPFPLLLLFFFALWAAAVGLSARKLHNRREMWMRPAMRFDLILNSRDLYCTIIAQNYIALVAVSRSSISILVTRFLGVFRSRIRCCCCSLRVWLSQSVVVYSRAAGRCLRCEAMNFSWILIRDFSPPSSVQIASALPLLCLYLCARRDERAIAAAFLPGDGAAFVRLSRLGVGFGDAGLGFA